MYAVAVLPRRAPRAHQPLARAAGVHREGDLLVVLGRSSNAPGCGPVPLSRVRAPGRGEQLDDLAAVAARRSRRVALPARAALRPRPRATPSSPSLSCTKVTRPSIDSAIRSCSNRHSCFIASQSALGPLEVAGLDRLDRAVHRRPRHLLQLLVGEPALGHPSPPVAITSRDNAKGAGHRGCARDRRGDCRAAACRRSRRGHARQGRGLRRDARHRRRSLPDLTDIDVCVSNAAITDTVAPAHKMSPEQWTRDIDVNLSGRLPRGAGVPVRDARTSPRPDGGDLERRRPRRAARPGGVRASKAGLLGMVKTIAAENAGKGVTANAVLPGMIATEAVRAMPTDVLERVVAALPLGPDGRGRGGRGARRLPGLG